MTVDSYTFAEGDHVEHLLGHLSAARDRSGHPPYRAFALNPKAFYDAAQRLGARLEAGSPTSFHIMTPSGRALVFEDPDQAARCVAAFTEAPTELPVVIVPAARK